ncbi:MAG: fumarylacetoacetate hydrolase family protein [Gammaproteobacteria bacterium]|nr:fumarylacetoacetate hydrolase family protein [Gammaproteobacteria bacterium]
MNDAEHRARAATLFAAHRERARFEPFAGAAALPTVADAYAVQAHFVERLCAARGVGIAGWKIGLTSPRMQALLGIDSPIAGAVLTDRVRASGARYARADHGRLGLECEIAVRLGRDLPAHGAPYDFDAVADAVAAVCAAIEVVDDRDADYAVTDIGSLVADNCWNAGLVLGEFHAAWPDLAAIEGVVHVDGAVVDRGHGADVLGHPFVPLQWLANHLAAQGRGLRAGDLVSTGSLAPTRFPGAPERCRFTLEGLGEVELEIA